MSEVNTCDGLEFRLQAATQRCLSEPRKRGTPNVNLQIRSYNFTHRPFWADSSTAASTRWFFRPSSNVGWTGLPSTQAFTKIGDYMNERVFVADTVSRRPPMAYIRLHTVALSHENVAKTPPVLGIVAIVKLQPFISSKSK